MKSLLILSAFPFSLLSCLTTANYQQRNDKTNYVEIEYEDKEFDVDDKKTLMMPAIEGMKFPKTGYGVWLWSLAFSLYEGQDIDQSINMAKAVVINGVFRAETPYTYHSGRVIFKYYYDEVNESMKTKSGLRFPSFNYTIAEGRCQRGKKQGWWSYYKADPTMSFFYRELDLENRDTEDNVYGKKVEPNEKEHIRIFYDEGIPTELATLDRNGNVLRNRNILRNENILELK